MNPRARFFATFINAVFYYFEVRKKSLFDPIDKVARRYWTEIGKLKTKEARYINQIGYERFKRLIKWAAKPHHVQELIKIVNTKGEIIAGEYLFQHAKKHHII